MLEERSSGPREHWVRYSSELEEGVVSLFINGVEVALKPSTARARRFGPCACISKKFVSWFPSYAKLHLQHRPQLPTSDSVDPIPTSTL